MRLSRISMILLIVMWTGSSVDIGGAKTKKLAWMGSSSDTLTDNPEKNETKLTIALDKIFKKFPPAPEK
jgi:hypothetical protein